MLDDPFKYGLLLCLAIALLVAGFTDWRARRIGNWLTGAIALTAPLFWWASGLPLWPGVAEQVGVALLAFAILAGLFATGAMGGGDVKLLTALALWVDPASFLKLVIIMTLLGGLLTLVLGAWHITCRRKDRLSIPYGLAIASAGIWVLSTNYWPPVSAGTGLLG
jgi:prepilin peptidase CpaA